MLFAYQTWRVVYHFFSLVGTGIGGTHLHRVRQNSPSCTTIPTCVCPCLGVFIVLACPTCLQSQASPGFSVVLCFVLIPSLLFCPLVYPYAVSLCWLFSRSRGGGGGGADPVWAVVATRQAVMLVTKEVDMGTYQQTLLEIQDEVQVC